MVFSWLFDKTDTLAALVFDDTAVTFTAFPALS